MTSSIAPVVSPVAALPIARRAAPTRLLVPLPVIGRAVLVSVVVALLVAPAYADTSWWIGLGVAMLVFTIVHGAAAAYRTVWLPGVIGFAACVQWVIAAWSDYGVPGRMAVPPEDYFRFAVPSTLVFLLGLYWPLWRARARTPEATAPLERATASRVEQFCRVMVIGGVFLRVAIVPFTPMSVRYAAYMTSMLAIVGALGLVLLAERRWPLWVIVAFAPVAYGNVSDLQFLDSIQYAFCIACVVIYRFRPSRALLMLLAIPSLSLFLAISAFKAYSREDMRKQEQSVGERATATSTTLLQFARQPSVLLGPTVLRRTVGRLNEGWITSRMLAWMPTAEPYARGETLITGLRSAVLPRLFDPGKFVVGGKDIIPRFTGIELLGSTAMGLSVPGEMYANFGYAGMLLATFVYALCIGLIYRSFLRRSYGSILWWAWAPFVLFSTLSPEQGFAENANHIAKSLIVTWAVVRFAPAWRVLPRYAARRRAVAATAPAAAAIAGTLDEASA